MRELSQEDQEVRRQDLRDVQDAPGWQWLLAALKSQRRGLERTIARTHYGDISEIRFLQGKWALLETFLADPPKFCEVAVYEEGEKINEILAL